MIEIVSKNQVEKEMITVPGKLDHNYYFKEVVNNDTCYVPVTVENFLRIYHEKLM